MIYGYIKLFYVPYFTICYTEAENTLVFEHIITKILNFKCLCNVGYDNDRLWYINEWIIVSQDIHSNKN